MLVWCAVFLDGPHVLQPADLAFGNSVESLEETGEAATEPGMAPRAWGFRATPENLEPGLVEALEVIKDVLLKDTYVVRAQSRLSCRVYARLVSEWLFFKCIGCLWVQPRGRHGCDRRCVGEHIGSSCLCAFVCSCITPAGETALIPAVRRRRETHTSAAVSILWFVICSELMVRSSANSVCRWQGIARPVQPAHRCSPPLTLRRRCISSVGQTSLS